MPDVVLLDSIGELTQAWALAEIGFTGGSFDGKRGGQSMIEPAALGVPTLFGPHVWNFRDAAHRLVEAGGSLMLRDPDDLPHAMETLLTDTQKRSAMGTAAQQFVRSQQGATIRTINAIDARL